MDNVIEIDLEVEVGEVALDFISPAAPGALWADHLAEVDDLLLDVGDVAHDLLGAALEDSSSRDVDLLPILRSIGKQ